MPVTYPLDTSGVNPSNLVTGELHTVSGSQFRDYFFIIPQFAPIFTDNFSASITSNGVTRSLVEHIDFSFCLSYETGTRTTGKAMYGGITLHNLEMDGIITINGYQTIGGDQVADRLHILNYLAEKAYNPRTTIWDIVTNVPTAFPPVPHYQDYDDFKGQEAVVEKLEAIRVAIASNSSLTSTKIQEFLDLYFAGTSTFYVRKTGDGMTGPLVLHGDPSLDAHAATKKYVDDHTVSPNYVDSRLSEYSKTSEMNQALDTKISRAGDTMVGPLVVPETPQQSGHATSKAYVDSALSALAATYDQALLQLSANLTSLQNGSASIALLNQRVDEIMLIVNRIQLQRS